MNTIAHFKGILDEEDKIFILVFNLWYDYFDIYNKEIDKI